jgi:type I site-specific restriction endonuclease
MLEDEREFSAEKIEKEITSIDSNRKILKEIKRYADEHEERYGRFPKTLIFAVQDLAHTSHADQIVDLARDVFGRGMPLYIRSLVRLTGHYRDQGVQEQERAWHCCTLICSPQELISLIWSISFYFTLC